MSNSDLFNEIGKGWNSYATQPVEAQRNPLGVIYAYF